MGGQNLLWGLIKFLSFNRANWIVKLTGKCQIGESINTKPCEIYPNKIVILIAQVLFAVLIFLDF